MLVVEQPDGTMAAGAGMDDDAGSCGCREDHRIPNAKAVLD